MNAEEPADKPRAPSSRGFNSPCGQIALGALHFQPSCLSTRPSFHPFESFSSVGVKGREYSIRLLY